ncbi:MAG: nucleotidyltransferase domain-containing protein [candidate division WOR-3 bacterium]|nr:nucleotidyltransferase domain-containing protein [candidate division WOR-3 bacterium]
MSTVAVDSDQLAERVHDYPHIRAVVEQVVRRLVVALSPRQVILYGSYVHGRPTPDSDLDFLVISDSTEPNYRQSQNARKVIGDVEMPVDVFVLPRQEFDETKHVIGGLAYVPAKYGVVVYEKP